MPFLRRVMAPCKNARQNKRIQKDLFLKFSLKAPQPSPMPQPRPLLHRIGLACFLLAGQVAAWAQACAPQLTVAPTVVELYTSQSCSSCPPADRWLSGLMGQDQVLALAFHVNYWNHLSWVDRYATAATTERQYQWQRRMRTSYVYTPQVIVNGQDWRDWQTGVALPPPVARQGVHMQWQAQGATPVLAVETPPGLGTVSGYWVQLQDQASTRVTDGENKGRTLRNDHIVHSYAVVPPWQAGQTQRLAPPQRAAGMLRMAFVLTRGDGPLDPVQAGVLTWPNTPACASPKAS